MAAWISGTPGRDSDGVFKAIGDLPGVMRRLLISQDQREIYITLAEYDKEYEAYITGHRNGKETLEAGPPAPARVGRGFLTMNCFGPFHITQVDEMKAFCTAVVALTREAINL